MMLERNGIRVAIGHFPYRKKPCLYIQEGNVATKVASFNSEETAEWFEDKMRRFFDGLIAERKDENNG